MRASSASFPDPFLGNGQVQFQVQFFKAKGEVQIHVQVPSQREVESEVGWEVMVALR